SPQSHLMVIGGRTHVDSMSGRVSVESARTRGYVRDPGGRVFPSWSPCCPLEGGNVAEAVVGGRHLLKPLPWYNRFVICLANPGFLLGSLGFAVLDLGGWGAMLIWGLTAVIVFPVQIIYSELAAMFPNKSGGVSVYANEAWRKYTTLIGPIATFGYWIGWSVVLSFLGLFVGYIAQTAWFPGEPYGTYAFGGAKI